MTADYRATRGGVSIIRDGQAGHPGEVAEMAADQRQVVDERGGGDPDIVVAEATAGSEQQSGDAGSVPRHGGADLDDGEPGARGVNLDCVDATLGELGPANAGGVKGASRWVRKKVSARARRGAPRWPAAAMRNSLSNSMSAGAKFARTPASGDGALDRLPVHAAAKFAGFHIGEQVTGGGMRGEQGDAADDGGK